MTLYVIIVQLCTINILYLRATKQCTYVPFFPSPVILNLMLQFVCLTDSEKDIYIHSYILTTKNIYTPSQHNKFNNIVEPT